VQNIVELKAHLTSSDVLTDMEIGANMMQNLDIWGAKGPSRHDQSWLGFQAFTLFVSLQVILRSFGKF
jgi:hypothetical protein